MVNIILIWFNYRYINYGLWWYYIYDTKHMFSNMYMGKSQLYGWN